MKIIKTQEDREKHNEKSKENEKEIHAIESLKDICDDYLYGSCDSYENTIKEITQWCSIHMKKNSILVTIEQDVLSLHFQNRKLYERFCDENEGVIDNTVEFSDEIVVNIATYKSNAFNMSVIL